MTVETADPPVRRWEAPRLPTPGSGRRSRPTSSREALVFATAVALFLLVTALTFANTPDDPLITLRYAANLLHHGQPVYNLGQRTEGYTSPLHLLLATALLALPGSAVLLKLKLVSLAFGIGALWETKRLAEGAQARAWVRMLSVLAVAGSWNFVVSAGNGLETSLDAVLVTGTLASLARREHLSGSAWLSG